MRLRITFSKSGALRYIGHLDLHSLWERTVRRAGLPLSYTQGFHPGPRIQLASALPLGFIGCAEIVDLWIDETPGLSDLPYKDILQSAAPPGLVIYFRGNRGRAWSGSPDAGDLRPNTTSPSSNRGRCLGWAVVSMACSKPLLSRVSGAENHMTCAR